MKFLLIVIVGIAVVVGIFAWRAKSLGVGTDVLPNRAGWLFEDDRFSIEIPENFKQRGMGDVSLNPAWLFYGSVDGFSNENRIYIENSGPFDFKVMNSNESCLEFTKAYTRDNPGHWTTELLEYKQATHSKEFNTCHFKYITRRDNYNLIYEHVVYLPPTEVATPRQFDVFMYYFEGTSPAEIQAMESSIRSFRIK